MTRPRNRPCIDCLAELPADMAGTRTAEDLARRRPTPHPGPRCATHWRIELKARQVRSHARSTSHRYGLSPEQYSALYEAQGRHCAICQRATGATRRLSVDHDHQCGAGHPPERGCLQCIRALLCRPCNDLLGRYDAPALTRAIEVLTDPPARKLLSGKRPGYVGGQSSGREHP